jgi:hypothetical protein
MIVKKYSFALQYPPPFVSFVIRYTSRSSLHIISDEINTETKIRRKYLGIKSYILLAVPIAFLLLIPRLPTMLAFAH